MDRREFAQRVYEDVPNRITYFVFALWVSSFGTQSVVWVPGLWEKGVETPVVDAWCLAGFVFQGNEKPKRILH